MDKVTQIIAQTALKFSTVSTTYPQLSSNSRSAQKTDKAVEVAEAVFDSFGAPGHANNTHKSSGTGGLKFITRKPGLNPDYPGPLGTHPNR
ncbi:hypothetical protein TNCV_4061361 [Trichonephila clavipes]|nr:hypothetical protein TNCV_4061361 [Trichonephila clavipes]